MRDELAELSSPEERLDAFERMLADRLPVVRGLHPAVARALQQFGAANTIREVVRQSGYSHRRFITLFSRAVGLTPKTYCRVLRFQHVSSSGWNRRARVADRYGDRQWLQRSISFQS
jgi:AraC-like DNA-binding protein